MVRSFKIDQKYPKSSKVRPNKFKKSSEYLLKNAYCDNFCCKEVKILKNRNVAKA